MVEDALRPRSEKFNTKIETKAITEAARGRRRMHLKKQNRRRHCIRAPHGCFISTASYGSSNMFRQARKYVHFMQYTFHVAQFAISQSCIKHMNYSFLQHVLSGNVYESGRSAVKFRVPWGRICSLRFAWADQLQAEVIYWSSETGISWMKIDSKDQSQKVSLHMSEG